MKRMLHRFVLSAVVFLMVPTAVPAQDQQDQTWAERQADRAAERAERLGERIEQKVERAQQQVDERSERAQERFEERMDRARERVEARAERVRERIERGAGWQFSSRRGAHISMGKSYVLPHGSVATEGIVVVGGDATIDGTAEDDVLVIGGRLRVGPEAVVRGDVATVGGVLDIDPAARIAGDVTTNRFPWDDWDWEEWGSGLPQFDDDWWHGAAFAFTIGRLAVLGFVALLLVLVAPVWVSSIASRLSGAPVVSTLAGVAGQVFFAPALVILTVALIITIVGIPLIAGLPFLVAGFVLLWIAGYAAVAGIVGARLRGSDWQAHGLGLFDVIAGCFVLSGVTLFGQVLMITDSLGPLALLVRATGWTIEYVAWTAGLGAALIAWRRPSGFGPRTAPPVVPPIPTPAPSAL